MVLINLSAVLSYFVSVWWVVRCHRQYLVLFGYLSFMLGWSLVSCFYNDLGIYNFELFRYTETSLATTRLALFYLIFNLGFVVAASFLSRRTLAQRDYNFGAGSLRLGNIKLSGYFVGLATIAYVVYSFATGGIPVLEGINRVLFFKEAGPIERILWSYGYVIAFTLGYFRRPHVRFSVNDLLLGLLLVYFVMNGDKFSGLIRLSVVYYAPVFVRWWRSDRGFTLFRLRYVLIGGVAVVALLLGAQATYKSSGLNPNEAQQLLLDRVLALQGHLWWATDHHLFVLDKFDSSHWLAEMGAVVNPGSAVDGAVGLKYVMVQAIGPEKAFSIFDTGYLYTMAYPAILVLTFSYPVAFAIQLLMGCLFCGLLYYLYYSVLYRHFVRALIVLTIIIRFMGVMGTGDFSVLLLTPDIAVRMFIIVLLELGVAKAVRQTNRGTGPEMTRPNVEAGQAG